MNKATYIIILQMIFLLFACNKNINFKENFENNENFKIIEINESNKVESLKISEFTKSIDFIRLETKPDCLIGEIDKISIDSNYIYILDKHLSRSLFLFKKNGEFVRKVGNIGNGPGEYNYVMDFKILKNNKLMLYDYSGYKVLFFENLNYIYSKKLEKGLNSITENGSYYYFSAFNNGRNDSNLIIVDEEFKVLKKEFPFPPKSKSNVNFTYDFRDYKDSITFIKPFDSKVYRIKGTTMIPKYYFDFGDKQLTYEHVYFSDNNKYEKSRYNHILNTFYENERYIIFDIVIADKIINRGLYNKKSGIVKLSKAFNNDIIKGAHMKYINSTDESIIGILEAKQVKYIKEEGVKEKLGLTGVNEMDNPIITISYFKKE